MISRYLFRDGVLSYKGTSLSTFEEVFMAGDIMLTKGKSVSELPAADVWESYKLVFNEPRFAWKIQPESVTQELRALLLLQQ